MIASPSLAVRLFGTEQVDAPQRILRAGAVSAAFDNGAIRTIRVGGVEVLRMIAFLVRDENWGTVPARIEDLVIDESAEAFEITYRGTCVIGSGHLIYQARIQGRDQTLSFVVKAEPNADILTNRTGFIVLHPIDGVAGRPVTVEHVDGSQNSSVFPQTVDPKCPFTDIRALTHEFAPGQWATCRMDGDAFEMEDQRNWSDASYKTYVRPLRRPLPYTLPKGQTFEQSVRLEISGAASATPQGSEQSATTLTLGLPSGPMPRVGVGVSAEAARAAMSRLDLIRQLPPTWMVCEIDLRSDHGRAELATYATLARETGAGLVLEIITRGTLDPAAELAPIAEASRDVGLALEAVTVFPAQDMVSVQPGAPWPAMPTFAQTADAARQAFPGTPLGGGMAAYFTELNRKRPPRGLFDYVTFTTCPSVHAADDISVMETLEAIPHLIGSTRSFMGDGTPVRIGPSQLGCRENPYGKATTPNTENARLCLSRLDPRQRGLFNAAWSLGYIAACSKGGVDAVALGDLTGPFGHIYAAGDYPQPWFDERGDPDAAVFPSFHVLAGLAKLNGAALIEVESSAPGLIAAIAAERDSGLSLWVANLTATTQRVDLPDAVAGGRIAILCAETFEVAATDPGFMGRTGQTVQHQLELKPYAVGQISVGR